MLSERLPDHIFSRTIGLETEYGFECGDSDSIPLITSMLASMSQTRKGEFITNGGRVYLDMAHPEYASPECCNPWEAALYHHSGDVLMADMVRRLGKLGGQVAIRRDNIDWYGESYGCHENYLFSRSISNEVLNTSLIPYLVSSSLLCGSGYLDRKGKFQLSARATVIDKTEGNTTLKGGRCIINTRDESHLPSDKNSKYRRLHLTCRDANVSHQATFLKIATTSIVLAMIESGWSLGSLYPQDPSIAMRTLNSDIGGNQVVATRSGLLTALDIQRTIAAKATEFLDRTASFCDLPDWVLEAHALWHHALDDIAAAKYDDKKAESSSWLDWWVKHNLLASYREVYPDASSEELFGLCMKYHDVAATIEGSDSCIANQLLHQRFSESELRYAAYTPSSHPRAIERATYVAMPRQQGVSQIGWVGASVKGQLYTFAFP